jgi:hypothetical protein
MNPIAALERIFSKFNAGVIGIAVPRRAKQCFAIA